MDKSKLTGKADPFKVLPMTEKEMKLNVANAIMKEANLLTNEAKQKEFELKKLRQRIAHLRGLLVKQQPKPAKKPVKKPAPKPQPKKTSVKSASQKPANKPALPVQRVVENQATVS